MNRQTRRRLMLSAGVGTIGALAGACGDGGSAGSGAPAPSAGPVKLAYLSNLADTHPEGAARLGLLAEYQKEFASKVSIDIEGGKAATPLDKYKSLAAGGAAPDHGYVAH